MIKQILRPSLIQRFYFSEYFAKRDQDEILEIYTRRFKDKRYLQYTEKWKLDLEKKHKRRARSLELERQRTPPQNDQAKFVVHNPYKPIDAEGQQFAVCIIGGSQYKVVQDDIVVSEYLEGLDINTTIALDKVLLLGSKDYTILGRPFIEDAKVMATVEQQTLSDKEIVFKKKRRKRYMKSQGHRQRLTVLRINEIVHNITEDLSKRAVSLA